MEKAIELGCYFLINSNMLKTKLGLEVINTVPVDRMLLETDASFAFKIQHIEEIEKETNAVYYYEITEEKGDRRCGLVI